MTDGTRMLKVNEYAAEIGTTHQRVRQLIMSGKTQSYFQLPLRSGKKLSTRIIPCNFSWDSISPVLDVGDLSYILSVSRAWARTIDIPFYASEGETFVLKIDLQAAIEAAIERQEDFDAEKT